MDRGPRHREVAENMKRKTIIFRFVLCEYETRTLTLTEGHRLQTFVYRVLRKISAPKGNEVTGNWMTSHNEVLHDLHS